MVLGAGVLGCWVFGVDSWGAAVWSPVFCSYAVVCSAGGIAVLLRGRNRAVGGWVASGFIACQGRWESSFCGIDFLCGACRIICSDHR